MPAFENEPDLDWSVTGPDCPKCLPFHMALRKDKRDGRWWCTRHKSYVDLEAGMEVTETQEAIAVTGEVVEGPIAPLTRQEAQKLTTQIKNSLEETWRLLLLAHDRGAWKVLGYGTFEAYCGREFDYSRSHAYRLIDHARFMFAIEDAAGLSPMGDFGPHLRLKERQTRPLKDMLPEVLARVEERKAEHEEVSQLHPDFPTAALGKLVLDLEMDITRMARTVADQEKHKTAMSKARKDGEKRIEVSCPECGTAFIVTEENTVK